MDFGPIKEKIIAEKDEIAEAAGQWFDSLPEKLGYVVGYAVTTLAGLPGAAADYFSQLVTDAESYMSELPGRISAWSGCSISASAPTGQKTARQARP